MKGRTTGPKLQLPDLGPPGVQREAGVGAPGRGQEQATAVEVVRGRGRHHGTWPSQLSEPPCGVRHPTWPRHRPPHRHLLRKSGGGRPRTPASPITALTLPTTEAKIKVPTLSEWARRPASCPVAAT